MRYWLPLVYAAVLLLGSVLGARYGLRGEQLAGLIVAVTVLYLVWLLLYLVPVARRAAAERISRGLRNIDAN